MSSNNSENGLTIPLTPTQSITVFMHENITNASHILQQVRTRASSSSSPSQQQSEENVSEQQQDAPPPPPLLSLLSPQHIVSLYHIYLSAFKSIQALNRQALRTKNIETELLLNLCFSRNLGEAFRLFGIKEDSTTCFVIIFHDQNDNNENNDKNNGEKSIQYMKSLIEGQLVPVDQMEQRLRQVNDRERIMKSFKLSSVEKESSLNNDQLLEQHVLSRLAIRDL